MNNPWENEPDEKEWKYKGYDLYIRRVHGHLNGYVKVPEHHPFYRKAYDTSGIGNLDVHGGVTFSNETLPGHYPGWWIGFDTAHPGDYYPGIDEWYSEEFSKNLVYRDIDYVTRQTEHLADQIIDKDSRNIFARNGDER